MFEFRSAVQCNATSGTRPKIQKNVCEEDQQLGGQGCGWGWDERGWRKGREEGKERAGRWIAQAAEAGYAAVRREGEGGERRDGPRLAAHTALAAWAAQAAMGENAAAADGKLTL